MNHPEPHGWLDLPDHRRWLATEGELLLAFGLRCGLPNGGAATLTVTVPPSRSASATVAAPAPATQPAAAAQPAIYLAIIPTGRRTLALAGCSRSSR